MPMLTDHEDTSRYSAPPDLEPEEDTYLLSQIMRYVESCCPHEYNYPYTIEEVIAILEQAADDIRDEEIGIDTV
jgi:hypothetical protein